MFERSAVSEAEAVGGCVSETCADEIVERVLDGLDQNDRMIRHAIKEFLGARDKALKEESKEEDILYRIQAAEVVDAIVGCLRQEIELDAAHRRMKLAAGRHEIAKKQVIQVIGEFEEELDPEEEWSLRIHQLVLLKRKDKDKDKNTNEVLSQAVQFAKSMATEVTESTLKAIQNHELPEAAKKFAKEAPGLAEFFSDLADLLLESGERGKRLVAAICDEPSVASEVAEDEDASKPVKFLAKLIVALSKEEGD